MPRITVLLADDHPTIRAGLRAVLEADGRFRVVGECSDAEALALRYASLKPDVALVAFELPGLGGLHATEGLLRRNRRARVVLMSIAPDSIVSAAARRAGAAAVVSKASSPARFVGVIARAARGRATAPPPRVAAWLTPRERQVVELVAHGLTGPSIAARLRVRVRTVHKHRENALRKLKLRGTAALIKYAVTHGLVALPS